MTLRNINCEENLFQDNITDVGFLLSDTGREVVINLHVNGIINYITTLILIFLFTRNYPSHAAFWIGHIALIPWNNMHVTMKYRLASSFAYVNTHIISIWVETLVNLLPNKLQHHIHRLAFVVGKIKVGSNVPLGDDERMTR